MDLYTLLPVSAPSSLLGWWESHLGGYSEVVGYSALGLFFLRDPSSNEFLVLHPLRVSPNATKFGHFESVLAFESAVLREEAFESQHLRPGDVRELASRLGVLEKEQVYYPVPFPILGGSGELHSYDKGNVWVFGDLAGQSRDQ